MEDGLSAGFILLGLGFCLVLSAFFSSTETAFFSLTQSILSELKEARDPRSRRVVRLLERPKELLITILSGNALVNAAIAVMATFLAIEICEMTGFSVAAGLTISVLLVTGLILILGEITPKIIAIKYAVTWALWSSLPLDLFRRLLWPLSAFLTLLSAGLSRALRVDRARLNISEDEIKTLVEVSEERGALEEDERAMIQGIFEISEMMVKEIMVPRVDIVSLPVTATAQDVITLVKERGHSRIPIYHESLDKIAGLIHVKDLLPYMENGDWKIDLSQIIREANFVPEGKKIDDLLRQFQGEKSHMAIVVDEYGGTAGLVTLEDVLEEIVGEIQDEYDREVPLCQKISEDVLVVDARIDIDELNEHLGGNALPDSDDYETLGGFIFSQMGDLPQAKGTIDYGNLHFIVEEVSGNRISQIRIEVRSPLEKSGRAE
ncbi:hemolysin family protein [bacterium]|nr:hemolysin family protein [bacterium]MBU1650706.1 hemolysin family protein [bacterium]MBU1882372.1 hemolysin family protein [bacterium]